MVGLIESDNCFVQAGLFGAFAASLYVSSLRVHLYNYNVTSVSPRFCVPKQQHIHLVLFEYHNTRTNSQPKHEVYNRLSAPGNRIRHRSGRGANARTTRSLGSSRPRPRCQHPRSPRSQVLRPQEMVPRRDGAQAKRRGEDSGAGKSRKANDVGSK